MNFKKGTPFQNESLFPLLSLFISNEKIGNQILYNFGHTERPL